MVNIDLKFRMKKKIPHPIKCLTSGSVHLSRSERISLGRKVKESKKKGVESTAESARERETC